MFTTRQLMFGIAAFIGGSSLFTVFTTQITFQDSWITALLAIAATLLTLLVYTALIRKFPHMGLLEMHTVIYGKWIGRLINLLYMLFCLGFSAVSLRNLGDFFTGYIMPETPMLVVLALFAAVSALSAKCGIAIVLRSAFLFFSLMVIALSLNFTLLIPNMQLQNFLPILHLGKEAYAHGTLVLTSAPLCEIIVFLILLPYADTRSDVRKSFFWGLLLGGLYLLFTFLRDIAVLGSSLSFLTEPTYEAIRLINILDIFSRLEILFAFILIIMRVFKLSVLFCALLRAAEDTRGKPFQKKGLPLLILCSAAIATAILGFRTGMTLPDWFRSVGTYLFSAFEIALPLLTLFISFLRCPKGKKL